MALTKIGTGGIKDDAASQAAIADEAVDEARLQISNAGSNGQFLQKQSGNTGGLTWASVSDTQLSTEQVQDIVGAMVTGNTETGITVTYEDGDGTLDFVVGTLNQDTTGTAAIATEITATANNSTDETVYPTFVDGATGTQGIETDSGLTYNPSTGLLSAVGLTLSGNLTVNGTTTTINSTTLAIDDKNIELGTVATPTDTTADGGGITLKGGTDKTITWSNATDTWDFNQNIKTISGTANLTIQNTSNTSYGGLEFDKSDGSAQFAIYSYDASHGSNANKVQLYNYTNSSIEVYTNSTLALTLTNSQNATFAGAVSDSKGDLRTIPQLSQNSAHTIVASDAGKHSINSSGGWVINTSTGFTAGQAITLINNSGSDQTITATGVTLYNTADAATGNRTLAGRGMATVICTASNTYYISGAGLS